MRTAILHAERQGQDIAERVLGGLRASWPTADLFTEEADSTPAFGRLARLPIESLQRFESRQAIRPYELVLSTSAAAAAAISLPAGACGVCFVSDASRGDAHLRGRWQFAAASEAVVRQLPLPWRERTAVVPPPIAASFFRPGNEPRESYYLANCRGGRTANLEIAVEACRRIGRELLIVGWEGAPFPALGPIEHAHFLGARPDEMLRDAYRRCRGLIAAAGADYDPALLEAQACGAPVIAWDAGGAREALVDAEEAGQGTAVFFTDPTVETLASAIGELERRPHRCSATLAWTQAAQFSPTRFAQALRRQIQAWREVAPAAGRRAA